MAFRWYVMTTVDESGRVRNWRCDRGAWVEVKR